MYKKIIIIIIIIIIIELYRNTTSTSKSELLTGAVSELEAEVGPPETVDGNRQFDHFTPSGAVVMVEHEGAVLWHAGLT